MRTTVNIDDRLLAEAKAAALRDHRTLGAVVEDALRVLLADRGQARPVHDDFSLPTGNAGRLRDGVDLEDKDQLAELLGDNELDRAHR